MSWLTTPMLLVTQPNFDKTTNCISLWSDIVVQLARVKNINVTVLKGKRANRKEFESVNRKIEPRLIFFNGHGEADSIYGQGNETLVKVGQNLECLRGKIVYALACLSGKVLGVESIKDGTKAYIGYQEEFAFYFDENKVTKPTTDTIASMYLEPSNIVVSSLLKGHTVEHAWENSQALFRKKIINLIQSGDKNSINVYLPYLVWDMQNEVCLGNKDATI